MNKVLKLQRVGLITPTVVEYEGKVLATNQLDIESTCNLWRCHFGFYPTEKIDLAMTKKEFSVIQQKTLSSVKSVYDLFYVQNFIPRVFESKEEVSEWGMYRTNEVEKLKAENAALRERLEKSVLNRSIYYIISVWNDATMTRQQEVRCGTVDYVCDNFVESNGLVLNWDEVYFTREAAKARLVELKGEER